MSFLVEANNNNELLLDKRKVDRAMIDVSCDNKQKAF